MDCHPAQEAILAAIDGDRRSDDAAAHVRECAACREFDTIQRAQDATLVTAILRPRLNPAFRPRLREAIRASAPVRGRTWLPDIAYVAGAVAGVALAFASSPYFRDTTPGAVVLVGVLGYVFQIALTDRRD